MISRHSALSAPSSAPGSAWEDRHTELLSVHLSGILPMAPKRSIIFCAARPRLAGLHENKLLSPLEALSKITAQKYCADVTPGAVREYVSTGHGAIVETDEGAGIAQRTTIIARPARRFWTPLTR